MGKPNNYNEDAGSWTAKLQEWKRDMVTVCGAADGRAARLDRPMDLVERPPELRLPQPLCELARCRSARRASSRSRSR